jgi:multicomponent K+:H+ antiporter subunit E
MSRLLPYPLLSLGLFLMWLLLNLSLAPAHLVLGAILGVAGSWAMTALEPEKPRIRRPGAALRLAGLVLADIVRSNVAVARIILSRRMRRHSGFLAIRLELRDRHGLATLACIVTATPGTLWVDYDPVKGVLLLHILDLVDEGAWIRLIKTRYESLLLEIFE